MELGLLAPGLLGLAFAAWVVVSARSIARRSVTAAPSVAEEEPPNPFEFSPPVVPKTAEGTIPSHPIEEIREMALPL